MGSKQLKSILSKVPSATIKGEIDNINEIEIEKKGPIPQQVPEQHDRIVAQVPLTLKEEIRSYIKAHKGETERTVVLKALKLMGFNIPNSWLIDKRTLR